MMNVMRNKIKFMKQKAGHRPSLVLLIVFIILGTIALVATNAAVPTASIEPEGGAKTGNYSLSYATGASGSAVRFGGSTVGGCGKQIPNYPYEVPFRGAIWNQPICGLTRHPQSADYANRLYQWGHVNDGSSSADVNNGKIGNDPGFPAVPTFSEPNPLRKLFTREVYYASKSTTEKRIGTVSYYSNLDAAGDNTFTPNAKIPWNPEWEASQGGDNEMIIIEDRENASIPQGHGLAPKGSIYMLSGYYPEFPKWPERSFPPAGCPLYWSNFRLCTYDTSVSRDLQGNYIDLQTYEGFIKDRGVGLSYLATLTLPEEVEAEEIRHAIGISIPNTSYGPICTPSQLQEPINWNIVGKQCGTAVAPATKFEWANAPAPPVVTEPYKTLLTIDKTIPEGMLFSIDMTYDQIDTWVNSRTDLNATRKKTARVFARAIKDYGMMVVDTNGGRISIQTSGGINPDSAKKWTDLGMGPAEKDNLLDGLLTASNIYVVNPPVATCKDGSTSRFYCEWTSIRYGN